MDRPAGKGVQFMIDLPSSRQACLLQQCHFAVLFLANTHTQRRRACAFDFICSSGSIERNRRHHCWSWKRGWSRKKKEKKRDRLQELLCLVKPAVNEQNTASQVKEARETSFHANKLRVSRSANPAHSGADRPQFSCIKEKANDTDANLF